MRIFLGLLVWMVGSVAVFGGGFTVPKGVLYSKLSYQTRQVDDVYNGAGDRQAWSDQSPFESGLDTDAVNLFVGYGFTDRLSVTGSAQYLRSELDNVFAEDTSTSGISDFWLDVQYLIAKGQLHWVAEAGMKLPQQDNEPRSPQITNGETAYNLGLGVGYGGKRSFAEASLSYVIQDGFVNDVQANGIPYEDTWRLDLKWGWKLTDALEAEVLLNSQRTTADLGNENFIPGIYSNADEDVAGVNLTWMLGKRLGIGLSVQQTLKGKNVLRTESLGVYGSYRWSRTGN